jgi:PAP2 superfamily
VNQALDANRPRPVANGEGYWQLGIRTVVRATTLTKVVLVAGFFLIAFILDLTTGQRYSPILGSAAIITSAFTVWPWRRSILLDALGYATTWLVFGLVRATAYDAGLSLAAANRVGNLESSFFGGRSPSALLQDAVNTYGNPQLANVILAAVHLSFFVVPASVAVVLRIRGRDLFLRYWVATGICLSLAAIFFAVLPTAPPWLHPDHHGNRVIVELAKGYRVSAGSLGANDGEAQALSFDPNQFAALPSVHVAAAVLVFLATWRRGSSMRWFGLTYSVAMSTGVIYLAEHYVVDVIGGWLVAFAGWRASGPTLRRVLNVRTLDR